MKFAHFAHVWGKAGMTPAERYRQLWRELQLCDELGFDYGFCVEHHFRPDESWMSAPSLYAVGGGARTKRIRLGGMGHIVPLHHPLRLTEEIALADNMIEGRLEVGLVPGITPANFGPFGVNYETRREVTMEFVGFLKAAFGAKESFDFAGKYHNVKQGRLAVLPMQRPHPPLWIETRDPDTLAFCAKEGINSGYFFLYPREHAAPRYRRYLEQWREAGRTDKPHIAYSCVCYVAPTDAEAMKRLKEAGAAYRGFLPPVKDDAELAAVLEENARRFEARGEPGAARGRAPSRRRRMAVRARPAAGRLARHGRQEIAEDRHRGRVRHVLRRIQFRQHLRGGFDALDPPLRHRGHAAAEGLLAVLGSDPDHRLRCVIASEAKQSQDAGSWTTVLAS